jgi:hypothetical protein
MLLRSKVFRGWLPSFSGEAQCAPTLPT